jgi:CubicO group peptidase (beta-lactamase class C family)
VKKLENFIKRRNLIISLIFSLVMIAFSFSLLPLMVRGSNGELYWPTNEWTEVNPESQGLDPNSISSMFEYIEDTSLDVHSVIIVRNGYLLTEEFLYDSQLRDTKTYYGGSTLHAQYSTTKSLMALLIGIAIEEGYLSNISQTLYEFFADTWNPSFTDSEQKKNITIEQLLTMNAGFIGMLNFAYPSGSTAFDDCVNWALADLPLEFTPGEEGGFEYSNDGPNLLSAIITNVTGQTSADFVQEHLFNHMGITEAEWDWWADTKGISFGGYGFECSPRVQAKLGLLCLNNGTWNGTQLIPSDWVREATTYKVDGRWVYSPPSKYFNYGYLFYTNDSHEGYHTSGAYGQSIFINPEYDIVVAYTGGLSGAYDLTYRHLIQTYILQFWAGPDDGAIPGIPLVILMSTMIIAIGYHTLTLKKKRNFSIKK